ncbi:MAG TPA: hypothetical protein VKT81_18400 [Bryobacteraceae bacterium]|nr:hypothetical protein [Bryobacteraceae bacterium]
MRVVSGNLLFRAILFLLFPPSGIFAQDNVLETAVAAIQRGDLSGAVF